MLVRQKDPRLCLTGARSSSLPHAARRVDRCSRQVIRSVSIPEIDNRDAFAIPTACPLENPPSVLLEVRSGQRWEKPLLG